MIHTKATMTKGGEYLADRFPELVASSLSGVAEPDIPIGKPTATSAPGFRLRTLRASGTPVGGFSEIPPVLCKGIQCLAIGP